MDVIFAVLADSANISQEGKLNILGNFADISATKFPTRHPEMQLVLRLQASPAEAGKSKKMEVTLIGPDGERIGNLSADFEVPESEPGSPVDMQTIIRLVDTVFPKPGRYAVHVLINGDEKAHVPLNVKEK